MPPKSGRGRRGRGAARKSSLRSSSSAADDSPDLDAAKTLTDSSPAPESNSDEKAEESAKEGQDEGVSEEPEALGAREEVEGSSGSVGKGKRMVKKTVKVVKKVIKKVPRKVAVKGGELSCAKDENLGETESGLQVSDVSKMEEAKTEEESGGMELDKDVKEKESEGKDDGVEVEGECGKVEESGAMEVDKDVKKEDDDSRVENGDGEVKEEKENEVKNGDEEVKDKEKENEKENEDLGVKNGDEEAKEKKENEDLNVNNGDEEKKENEDLSVKNGDEEVKDKGNEKEKEKVDTEVENGDEEKEKEKEGGAEADVGGEAKFFSGELEAMERRKRRRTEIFIGGLDKDATEEDVRKVFEQVGEIVDLRVVMNAKTGKNKGFAFLRYASADDARKALEKFAKVEICGKQCGATPVEGNDTIFLGNIDKKWKDEDVTKLLQETGIEKIDKVTVMIDPNKADCNRGFAFVEFETSKDAQNAFKKLQKKEAFGKNLNIKVAWAEPLKELDEEEMLKVKTIYAEFIPSSWDEEKVRDTFKKFGEIDDIVLARNLKTTKRKDFAFINYKTREAAIECIESFSREITDEDGTKVNVKVSLAKPMQKGKKQKPVAKPAAKEVPRKKQKISHNKSRASELVQRAQQALPRYDIQFGERPSTNAELAHLYREQGSWRPPHVGMNSGPVDMHYPSSSLPVRKHQHSMLEADPWRPDMGRYPYPHLDAPYPVASSSRNVMPLPTSGLPSSMAYHQQHNVYPPGSVYGASNYPSNTEMRGRPHGSNYPYHRY